MYRLAYILGVQPTSCLHPTAFLTSSGTAIVMLNGSALGSHSSPHCFVDTFRLARRSGIVSSFASIFFMQDTVQIAVDGGRLCRPLVVCDHGVPRLKQRHVEVGALLVNIHAT
jgi:DNA-directed RNA polymerase III subunit RPC2